METKIFFGDYYMILKCFTIIVILQQLLDLNQLILLLDKHNPNFVNKEHNHSYKIIIIKFKIKKIYQIQKGKKDHHLMNNN